MIKSKKLVITAALCAFTAALSFAQEVTFENKLSSNLVDIVITDDDTDNSFAGITNEATAEYSSDKLDMGVTLISEFNKDEDVFVIGSDAFVDDYFIEFRPIELIGIGFHKGYNVAGSFLPCLDAEIEASNIGSDLGVFIYPLEGLVISGGVDYISLINDDDINPIVNFGAEYTFEEMLAFGAAFRNIASDDEDDRSIGAYASYTGIEGFTLNAGFTYNGEIEDFNISGNLINAAIMFEKDALSISADAVFAIGGDEDESNEIYTAASVTYSITEPFSATLYGSFTNDSDNDDSWCVGINPSAGYTINEHHSIEGGVNINIMKEIKNISFPVSWKYVF